MVIYVFICLRTPSNIAWKNADFLVGQGSCGVVGSKHQKIWPIMTTISARYPWLHPSQLIQLHLGWSRGARWGIRSCESALFGPPTTPSSPPGRRANRACAHLGKGTWHIWWDPATAAPWKKTWMTRMTCCWCPTLTVAILSPGFMRSKQASKPITSPTTRQKHPKTSPRPSRNLQASRCSRQSFTRLQLSTACLTRCEPSKEIRRCCSASCEASR